MSLLKFIFPAQKRVELKVTQMAGENLFASYAEHTVLKNIQLKLNKGELLGIIGPNGSGKSTLLRCLARTHTLDRGEIKFDGNSIHAFSTRSIAKLISFLPQESLAPPGLTVRELVSLGRHPHHQWWGEDPTGKKTIDWALEQTGLTELQRRPLDSLSGGQRQKAWIALALAQGAALMLLDEPTNHLDPAHRVEVVKVIKNLVEQHRYGVAMVMHDLILASKICDRIAIMSEGSISVIGHPKQVMTEKILSQIYQTPFQVLSDPSTGTPIPLQNF